MVIRRFGGAACGSSPPARYCAAGHGLTPVVRVGRVRYVCLTCLGGAIDGAAARSGGVTACDFLAKLDAADGGAYPKLPARDAEAAAALMQAAAELHGDPDGACARAVVRDVARAIGRPAREVMAWTLRRLVTEGLPNLATA